MLVSKSVSALGAHQKEFLFLSTESENKPNINPLPTGKYYDDIIIIN